MILPGFTAEQSVYRSAFSYVTASVRDAAAEQPSVTLSQDDITHQYTVRLDNFWVTYPRSKYTDTVTAAIGAAVRNPASFSYDQIAFGRYFVTDVGHGGVNVNFEQSFIVKNSDLVKIGIGLENANDHSCAGKAVVDLVYGRETNPSPFGIGPIWPVDSSFTQYAYVCWPWPSTCDGVVAADGALVYGADLESMTAAGPSTRTVMFPGTDSNWGCGRNSLYYMTWTIQRDW